MKEKLKKILFVCSFIPYAIVPIYGIYGAVKGALFFDNTYYGLDGFEVNALVTAYALTVSIPVIPVCAVFHIFCILRKKLDFFKKMNFKKFAAVCGSICGITLIAFLISAYSFDIRLFFEKINAVQMSARADEKIPYRQNEIFSDGIFDISEYKTHHIFIDYSKKDVGFLMNAGYSEYKQFRLTETTKDSAEYRHITETYFVQNEIPLSSPGEKLVSYYTDEPHRHLTSALILYLNDGSIFFIDNMTDKDTGFTSYLGLV